MSRQLTQSRYLRRVFNLGSIRGLKQLSSNQIRKEFQQYFNQYGFQIESSASLIPHGDKSLLFTNAGMVPLKGYFLQPETTSIKRLTTIQKCVRAGGKYKFIHIDLI
jgi:alanyl-tRNA synthetase